MAHRGKPKARLRAVKPVFVLYNPVTEDFLGLDACDGWCWLSEPELAQSFPCGIYESQDMIYDNIDLNEIWNDTGVLSNTFKKIMVVVPLNQFLFPKFEDAFNLRDW